jgi:hypothetical protein
MGSPDAYADVALAYPRDRTHVNAAAFQTRAEAHDNVILESKPGSCVGGFDSQRCRFGRHNFPPHVLRCLQSIGICRNRCSTHEARIQVGISLLLLHGKIRSTVFGRVVRARTQRQNGDEERRIFCIGGDVVDVRHARQIMFPLERQPKHTGGNCQPDDRRSHPLRKHCCLPCSESSEANDQRTGTDIAREFYQTDPRLESPQSHAIA